MTTQHHITIAIDGFSSSGKSTLAKDLAQSLNYAYLDSGAMYRAVALHCLNNHIDISNTDSVTEALANIHLIIPPAKQKSFSILLNNLDVTEMIRSMEVSSIVSEIAAISTVRTFLVAQQRLAGKDGGIVMDGRDIGSVVFPDAELKIYVESNLEIRVERRYQELKKKGSTNSIDEVRSNLSHRDYIDSHRADSPLIRAKDAYILDNTNLNREEQLSIALQLARTAIGSYNR